MQKKQKTIVVGQYLDAGRQIWSPNTEAFDSFAEAVDCLGTKDRYFEDLAYELGMSRSELESKVKTVDNSAGLDALLRVLQASEGVAVKMFRSQHEASSFLRLVAQMAEKYEKEKKKRGAFA